MTVSSSMQILLHGRGVSLVLARQGANLMISRNIHSSVVRAGSKVPDKMGKVDPKLVLSSTTNNVTTLTMNDPKKLNGWTGSMMLTLRDRFVQHAKDPETKVLVLTGADPYYCAGVNLSATIQPMHPK